MNSFRNINIQRFNYFILLIFFVVAPFSMYAQQDSVSLEQKVEVFSQVREELHRYIGYEELLPKYISLLYDVTMNTNIGSSFVDISYLLLMFIPILFLLGLKNKGLKILTVALMVLFMVISQPNGFRANFNLSNAEIATQLAPNIDAYPFSKTPLLHIKLQLTQAINALYQPFYKGVIERFSGEGDAITYPILFLLLILTFYLISNRLREHPKGMQAIGFFFLIYAFLWLILGSGVVWYGLLILPLGIFFIGNGLEKNFKKNLVFKYTALIFGVFWLISATTYRFANYHLPLSQEDKDKGASQADYNVSAIHAGSLMYGLGRMDKAGVTDFLFPAYRPIIEEINNDPEAFVYRVGTYFQYFIDRNNERVLEDNQLAYFDMIQGLVDTDKDIAEVFRGQGYKFMLIDFNVHTIDRTPNGSLTKKAKRFEDFLIKNATTSTKFKVIGTDRVVINSDGQQVFGLRGQIVDNGSFIAFKINK